MSLRQNGAAHVAADVQQLTELGESGGKVFSTHAATHPYMQQCFVLKLALGFYAVLALIAPFFAAYSLDPANVHLMTFIIDVLLFLVLSILFHSARQQELLIKVREFGAVAAESKLGNPFVLAFACFAISFLLQIIAILTEAYTGEMSEFVILFVAALTSLLTLASILCVQRQQFLLTTN